MADGQVWARTLALVLAGSLALAGSAPAQAPIAVDERPIPPSPDGELGDADIARAVGMIRDIGGTFGALAARQRGTALGAEWALYQRTYAQAANLLDDLRAEGRIALRDLPAGRAADSSGDGIVLDVTLDGRWQPDQVRNGRRLGGGDWAALSSLAGTLIDQLAARDSPLDWDAWAQAHDPTDRLQLLAGEAPGANLRPLLLRFWHIQDKYVANALSRIGTGYTNGQLGRAAALSNEMHGVLRQAEDVAGWRWRKPLETMWSERVEQTSALAGILSPPAPAPAADLAQAAPQPPAPSRSVDFDEAFGNGAETPSPTAKEPTGTELQSEIAVLRENVEALRTGIDKLGGEAQSLRADASTVRGEVGSLRAATETLAGETNTLRADVQAMGGKAASLQADVTAVQGEVGTLRDGADTLAGETRELRADVQALDGEAKSLHADVATVRSEVGNLHDGANSLAGETKTLRADIQALGGKSTSLQADVTAMQGEVGSLRESTDTLAGESKELRADVSAVQGEVGTLRDGTDTLTGETKLLQADVTAVQGEVGTLRDDADALAGETKTLRADVQALGAEADAVRLDILSLGGETKLLRADIEALNEDRAARTGELQSLIQDLRNLGQQVDTLDATVAEQGRRIASLAEAEAAAGMIPAALDGLADRQAALERQLGDLGREIGADGLAGNLTDLRATLAAQDARSLEMERRFEARLQNRVSAISREIEGLRQQALSVQAGLSAVRPSATAVTVPLHDEPARRRAIRQAVVVGLALLAVLTLAIALWVRGIRQRAAASVEMDADSVAEPDPAVPQVAMESALRGELGRLLSAVESERARASSLAQRLTEVTATLAESQDRTRRFEMDLEALRAAAQTMGQGLRDGAARDEAMEDEVARLRQAIEGERQRAAALQARIDALRAAAVVPAPADRTILNGNGQHGAGAAAEAPTKSRVPESTLRQRAIEALQRGDLTGFERAFATLTALPLPVVADMVREPSGHDLALACRAADIAKAHFAAVLILSRRARPADSQLAPRQLAQALALFDETSASEANHALQGWRARSPGAEARD